MKTLSKVQFLKLAQATFYRLIELQPPVLNSNFMTCLCRLLIIYFCSNLSSRERNLFSNDLISLNKLVNEL